MGTKPIAYCNTRSKLDFLKDQLTKRDFTVSTMHAALNRKERNLAMEQFRSSSSQLLICTSPLHFEILRFKRASGIDVQQVLLVLNLDLPGDLEHYMQQSGSRFGCKVVVINFVTKNDV